MLKITRTQSHAGTLVKLEGKLLGPWADEVRGACRPAADARGRAVRLDLSDVTFVDEAGEALLHALLDQGVTLGACSAFVAELLRAPGGPSDRAARAGDVVTSSLVT